MKSLLIVSFLFVTLMSCNGNSNNGNHTNSTAIDTTQHANGITNGEVISTDTAAMRVNGDSSAGNKR